MPVTSYTWALGRKDVLSATLTPQTVNPTTGALSAATGASIQALFKTIEIKQSNTLEDISATSMRSRNMVIVDTGTAVHIEGLIISQQTKNANGTRSNVQGYDIFCFTVTDSNDLWTFYGVVQEYTDSTTGKGQKSFSLDLEMIDVGGNPTLT